MALRPLIYIAGPMTLGPMADNIRMAWEASEKLLDAGFSPIVPQNSFFREIMGKRRSHAEWLDIDKPMVLACAAVLRLPGKSDGADKEARWATEANISVWGDVDALIAWGPAYSLRLSDVRESQAIGMKILAKPRALTAHLRDHIETDPRS